MDVMMEAMVLEMDVILLFGLSFYFAAVVMVAQALTTMVVVATIVVYGLSFFSSSAVADVAEMAFANFK